MPLLPCADVHSNNSSGSFQRLNGERKYFSRINPNVEVHPNLVSNEYNAGNDNYGAKAHRDLVITRGEGFRKEKQKKKRGSYRGGTIDFETRSFKFDS